MPACGGVLAGEQPVREGRSAEQAIAAENPAPTFRNWRRDDFSTAGGAGTGIVSPSSFVLSMSLPARRAALAKVRCDSAEAQDFFHPPTGFKRATDCRRRCGILGAHLVSCALEAAGNRRKIEQIFKPAH
jgi:hypothetical protein